MKANSSENKKMIKKICDRLAIGRPDYKKGESMSNSRKKTRERKQMKIAEEKIEKRNSHGHLDLTAYEAVKNIVRQQQNRGETGIDRQI